MKLESIIKTKKQIEDAGYIIENNLIKEINVNTIAHFGNVTCFEIICTNVRPMSGRNNIKNLGYIIRAFVEMMDLHREDGLRLTEIKNIPCRLIFKCEHCVGFGHFIEDKFVFIDDFGKVDE